MDYGKLCGFLIYVLRKKRSVNKDGTILFEPHQNASIFKSYCSELYTTIVKKLPIAPYKFWSSSIKHYYASIFEKEKQQKNLSYSVSKSSSAAGRTGHRLVKHVSLWRPAADDDFEI